jgi:hypothetical protein
VMSSLVVSRPWAISLFLICKPGTAWFSIGWAYFIIRWFFSLSASLSNDLPLEADKWYCIRQVSVVS